MSKGQTLRVLVNARLTAAAEEIFALFERTIAEFEEELRRSKEENQRKQERLDSVLNPRVELLRADLRTTESPGPGVDQGLNQGLNQETPRIKEELEDKCIRSSSVCVKREESLLRQTEPREEPQGEEPQGEDVSTEPLLPPETEGEFSDNDEDWRASFSCSGALETEADGSSLYRHWSQPGTSVTANTRDMSGAAERAEEERPECPICKKTFRTKHNLKVHIKLHTGERPFSCTVCGKGFIVGSKLRLHMRTHTGERPFSCSVCGKTYMQKVHLDAHTRIHTGDRPFSCSLCEKTFTQNFQLKAHLKTHWEKDPSTWPQEHVQATFFSQND